MLVARDWGVEEDILNAQYYPKIMRVNEQYRSPAYRYKKNDVVWVIENDEGLVWVEVGDDPDDMTGFFMQYEDKTRIKPEKWHRFSALRDTKILVLSSHSCTKDVETREKGGKIPEEEFSSLLRDFYAYESKSRILTIEAAGVVAKASKKKGRTIGMCNGCFDLTHLGHHYLFEQAKSHCDLLFVVVNSDEVIAKTKGPDRPFVDFAGRLGSVAYNRFVDYVVMGESNIHLDVVDAILPDVYVATTETAGKSPEAMEVKSKGGEVSTVNMIKGYNTTQIALKIKR